MQNNIVKVVIWGKEVGSLFWDERRKRSVFSYHPDFVKDGWDIAPLSASIRNPRNKLPLYGMPKDEIYSGLPAFVADSLPGRWGNAVFNAWAAENHIRASEITAVDKLSFIGKRGMGALEFEPAHEFDKERNFQLAELYDKAMEILQGREEASVVGKDLSLDALYEVGTSAGGNHSKAVIAINEATGDIRSGQIMLPEGYKYYLLKFAESRYYPLTEVEMAYADMARAAGISMMPCKLIEVGEERHFLTERYDRKNQQKIHTQSLAAMYPNATSYEQLMEVCVNLSLPYEEKEETFRRAVFNILTTNVDAHIRNFEFMMEQGGDWHITPAFDLTFSCFNPHNKLDEYHYLSMNGKRTGITNEDMVAFARVAKIDHPNRIIRQCVEAVKCFRDFASRYDINGYWQDIIEGHFAKMNPQLLSDLHLYKPLSYDFLIEEYGIKVEDARWEEMSNGAKRLTAVLNGTEYKATVSPKSQRGKRMTADGGTKMDLKHQRKWVRELLLPKYLSEASHSQ